MNKTLTINYPWAYYFHWMWTAETSIVYSDNSASLSLKNFVQLMPITNRLQPIFITFGKWNVLIFKCILNFPSHLNSVCLLTLPENTLKPNMNAAFLHGRLSTTAVSEKFFKASEESVLSKLWNPLNNFRGSLSIQQIQFLIKKQSLLNVFISIAATCENEPFLLL